MLDLTREIKLDERSYRRYRRLQAIFYVFCFASSLFVAYLILFPTQVFNFSFRMLTSNKGNALNPRNGAGTLILDGGFPAEQKSYFDASLVGSFSKIKLSFTPGKSSASPENSHIDLRKSYRAFLYPAGAPLGFKNGTLLSNKNNFYLISDGKLKKFASQAVFEKLGFSKAALVAIEDEADLNYNLPGEEIIDPNSYPADSLFEVTGDYYRLNSAGALEKFTSEKAFLSQYAKNLAISKNSDFIESHPLAEKPLGFADGSLVSYGSSAYIVSKDRIYPIGDPEIFIAQGYAWDDIITISGDEFSLYEKMKLFTLTSVHPDGTIFFAPDSHEWYKVENGQKHLLPSEKIANSYLRKKPIEVLRSSLEFLGSCDLQKEFFGDYACFILLNDTDDSAGKYYEFTLDAKNDLRIDNLNLRYEKNMTMPNLKLAVRSMILKIKARYGIETAQ